MPSDPVILLGYVNQQLRDTYPSLEEFCKSNNIPSDSLQKKLNLIDYHYDKQTNQFV
jgi:hypothetical protein